MPRHRKRGGAATWSEWLDEKNPFKSKPAPLSVPSTPLAPAVDAGQEMAMTAGRRIKKHIGINPVSAKEARRLLKTAKGDRMLGRRKTRRSRRR